MFHKIWANLNYICKSTYWQASFLHPEQRKWIEKEMSQNLENLSRVIRDRIWRIRINMNQSR